MPEYAKQLNLDVPLNHHGISYLDFLSILHQSLVPRTYLEIGTDSGQSLLRMKCDALCIDPSFQIADNVLFGRRRTFFFQMTSSEFFRHYDLRTFFAGGVDIEDVGWTRDVVAIEVERGAWLIAEILCHQ